MTEESLKAQLDALGIDYDGRWGVAKLQEALDAATVPQFPWPTWGYSAEGARLFEDGRLPAGWHDTPAKVK